MRADARKNHSHLLAVARDVVTKHGVDASMRDIARRADVGLATLLRHFPTREALFEELLRTKADALTQKAAKFETSKPPDQALVSWFREGVAFVQSYGGVCALMASAHADPDSALYASSTTLHSAGARLLAPCSGRGNGTRRYGWGGPVRPDVGARLGGRPTLIRAAGGSPLSHRRERHPDKSFAQRCEEGELICWRNTRERVDAPIKSWKRSGRTSGKDCISFGFSGRFGR